MDSPKNAVEVLDPQASAFPSFPSFSALPTELRLKIWNYASRVQRVIELQYCIVDRKFFTFQHVPALLHTNREAREIALMHYHLSFGTDKNDPSTYFNNRDDIIYFGSRQYSDEISYTIEHFRRTCHHLAPHEKIQNLALAQHLWDRSGYWNPFATRNGSRSIRRFHEALPDLRKLIFVKSRTSSEDSHGTDDDENGIEAACEDYSGISLLESDCELSLLTDCKFALEAVISYFEAEKAKERSLLLLPKVVVMTYEFREVQ
jgi:hypothetical protein